MGDKVKPRHVKKMNKVSKKNVHPKKVNTGAHYSHKKIGARVDRHKLYRPQTIRHKAVTKLALITQAERLRT